uniref:Uncharacterized protein n=1 Tax=Setaria italica TaxID=4555 RepID=K3Y0S6_SETIT
MHHFIFNQKAQSKKDDNADEPCYHLQASSSCHWRATSIESTYTDFQWKSRQYRLEPNF